ncbi:MAG: 3-dehydroquinate synthase [Bacteroidales bacterium]|nr:3-dehydroquinate synthase [Bacteroidales bacterium]
MNATVTTLLQYLEGRGVRTVALLTDTNVAALYPHYWDALEEHFSLLRVVVPAGESSKSLAQAEQVWRQLLEAQCEKDIFMLNFGGGTVCDLGGFVAATYKRGVPFANCPTTLLAMIDAAIGGKNGIDMLSVKNCIGTIRQPDVVLPDDISFLQTLPEEELRSGFGELIKYALIGSRALFDQISAVENLEASGIRPEWITHCAAMKRDIVQQDPEDRGVRHLLNFGHTVGHALESLLAETGRPVTHGEAVAMGMLFESRLSARHNVLAHEELERIEELISRHFHIPSLSAQEVEKAMDFMLQDKKNKSGKINITLLKSIGDAQPDFYVKAEECVQVLSGC